MYLELTIIAIAIVVLFYYRNEIYSFFKTHKKTLVALLATGSVMSGGIILMDDGELPPVGATTYYVDYTDGSDSDPGTMAEPFKTLSYACTMLSAGDTLRVNGDTYPNTHITITQLDEGTAGNPITIMGNGTGEAIIDGDNQIPFELNWMSHLIFDNLTIRDSNSELLLFRYDTDNITIKNCKLQDSGDSAVYFYELSTYDIRDISIENCTINNTCSWPNGESAAGGAIYLRDTEEFSVENNTIYKCGRNCIFLNDGCDDGVVKDNYINTTNNNTEYTDNLAIYMYVIDNVDMDNITCYDNTVWGNGSAGFATIGGDTSIVSNITMYNNVLNMTESGRGYVIWSYAGETPVYNDIEFYSNTVYTVENPAIKLDCNGDFFTDLIIANNACSTFESYYVMQFSQSNLSDMTLSHNSFYRRDGGGVYVGWHSDSTTTRGTSAVITDQLFTSAPTGDFSLGSGSPCIDAGSATYAPAVDFDGVTRPQQTADDIGAFEKEGSEYVELDSFSLDGETTANWDRDNNDVQIDVSFTSEYTTDLYFTYNKGSSARTPTTSDYDAKITSASNQTDYDLDWTATAGWVEYDGTIYVRCIAHANSEYSSYIEATLSGGIDSTGPTFSLLTEIADTDSYGDGYNPNSGYYDDGSYLASFSGCTDSTSGINYYMIKSNEYGSYGSADEDGGLVGCSISVGTNNIYYKIVDNAGNEATGDSTVNVFGGTGNPTNFLINVTGNVGGFASSDPSYISDATSIDSGTLYLNTGETSQSWGITVDETSGDWSSGGAWKVVFEAGWDGAETSDTSSPYESASYTSDTGAEADITIDIVNNCGGVQQIVLTTTEDILGPDAPTNVELRPDFYDKSGEVDNDLEIYCTWTDGTDGDSGLYDSSFGMNDTAPTALAGNDAKATDNDDEPGATRYGYVRSVDYVGNWGSTANDTITIDYGAPQISTPYPSDGETWIFTQPTCNITVTDKDVDTMSTTFASNYTGAWVNYQTNSSNNDTLEWDFTGATEELTTYYWRVYCDDGTYNVSIDYEFTTKPSTWSYKFQTNGYDYFVWRGDNGSAYDVAESIDGFGTDDDSNSEEHIAIWNASATPYPLWSTYYGDGTGVNFTITSFMVVRTYLTGSDNPQIYDETHATWEGDSSVILQDNADNLGYNFTAYLTQSSQTLSELIENDFSTSLADNYWIAVWTGTTWQYYIEGFYDSGYTLTQFDVVMSKVSKTITWTY